MPCLQRTFAGWNLTQRGCNHKVSETEIKDWEYETNTGQEIKQIQMSLRYTRSQQFEIMESNIFIYLFKRENLGKQLHIACAIQ